MEVYMSKKDTKQAKLKEQAEKEQKETNQWMPSRDYENYPITQEEINQTKHLFKEVTVN
jgi:hypothetical protein